MPNWCGCPAEPKPMARRHLVFGDGHETCQTRLRGEQVIAARVKRTLGRAVADREESAFRIEQKAELHCLIHSAQLRLKYRQATLQTSDGFSGQCEVPLPTLDGSLYRLCPKEKLASKCVAELSGQRLRDIGQCRSQRRRPLQLRHAATGSSLTGKRCSERVEGVLQVCAGGCVCSQFVRELVQGLARQMHGVHYADTREVIGSGGINPLSTGVRQRDQVAREVAAIHGRDVARIQRTQVAGVVPVVKMTTA